MPSLKQYRDQIASVKNTRKITQAMKMVAAAKLKRAQERAQASQPFAQAMASILGRLASNMPGGASGPAILTGTGHDRKHLLVIISSDRGLAGGFNANLVRFARVQMEHLAAAGKEAQLMLIGRKANEALRREFSGQIVEAREAGDASFAKAEEVARDIVERFNNGSFDVCTLIYNEFVSVLTQKPSNLQLIPFQIDTSVAASAEYVEFEPNEEEVLESILPRNLAVQIFRTMLDSAAGEQAARMTAMDNATRNAGDMIKKVTLSYNRARQAYITKELIEIISGAEAV